MFEQIRLIIGLFLTCVSVTMLVDYVRSEAKGWWHLLWAAVFTVGGSLIWSVIKAAG